MSEATTTAGAAATAQRAVATTIRDTWFRRRALALLAQLRDCEILLVEGQRQTRLGQARSGPPLQVTLHVHDDELYRMMAASGSVGAAEAYMDGLWDCPDLTALVRILVRNRDVLDAMEGGLARIGQALLRSLHARNRNSRSGSRRNIAAHYDLGNELFKLFLSEDLMYSSAIFRAPDEPLEVASRRKLDRICTKLGLRPGMHVVEIGSGWGGFAIHAARHYGVNVTTTTISNEQYQLVCERVRSAGLDEQVRVLREDYRDLAGQFDRLVSIEMIEAIGHQYLDTYFGKVSELLKPDGMALIQAITIEDHRYERALKNVDFIQRFIFPGSFIPSVAAMLGTLPRVTDLRLYNLEDIGPSYALTLREWRRRFNARLPEVRALGYPERFIRMWNFYFAYCEGGFIERSIGNAQMLLVKPSARPRQFLPDLDPVV